MNTEKKDIFSFAKQSTKPNINTLKRNYDEFVNYVKQNWKYKVAKTNFLRILERKSSAFAKKMLNKKVFREMVATKNFEQLFIHYVAFLLETNSKGNHRDWIVRDNIAVTHIYYRQNTSEIFLISTKNNNHNDENAYFHAFKELRYMISEFKFRDLESEGISKKITNWLDEERAKCYSEERAFEDKWTFHYAKLDNLDYIPDETFQKNKQIESWGIPSIFLETQFNSFVDIHRKTHNNEFTINKTILKGNNLYIDIHKSNLLNDDNDQRILMFPVKISELAMFLHNTARTNSGSLDSLFTLNVRDQKTSKISKSIIESLRQQPEDFFMLNNGITVIADKMHCQLIEEELKIRLENIKIINGQQTSYSIYNWLDKEHFDRDWSKPMPEFAEKANVLFKAYKITGEKNEREKLFNNISKASNSQNAIKSKDLFSTAHFNSKLQDELIKIGINYSYRDGKSDFSQQLKNFPKITLANLLKMHYIKVTGEVWKRSQTGAIFDWLVNPLDDKKENNPLYKYRQQFDRRDEAQIVEELKNIALLQIYYNNRKKELLIHSQAMDLLVYVALLLKEKPGHDGEINVPEFTEFLNKNVDPKIDKNNFYKSKKHLKPLLEKLKLHYNL